MTKIDWDDVAKRLMNPTQRWVLEAVAESPEPLSAKGLARKSDRSLANVSYHLRKLAELGLVELVREEPVRGSVARYYVYANGESRA